MGYATRTPNRSMPAVQVLHQISPGPNITRRVFKYSSKNMQELAQRVATRPSLAARGHWGRVDLKQR